MKEENKKAYVKPEIVFETDLETKAGSPGPPKPCGDELLLPDC